MKIGIDAHSIGSGKGGNETHFTELVRALARVDQDNHYFVLGCRDKRLESEIGPAAKFRFPSVVRNPVGRICASLPWAARRDKLDIFHAQSFPPPFLKCKVVTTILDLAFEHYPQFFSSSERAWMGPLIRRAAHSSHHILTSSQHGKNDLASTYGVDPDKITVSPLAAAEQFRPHDRAESQALVSRKYGVQAPFLLYIGRLQARKNLVRLVEAYDQVLRRGATHKLAIAGKADATSAPLFARVKELGLDNKVIFLGRVPWADLPLLYGAADVFVFPSFFEGFGLPIIEAMACGVPVVTSLGSSMEEIADGAALLVDPHDTATIAAAIEKILSDPQESARLRAAGLRRAAEFSFEQTARKTLQAYRLAAGSSRT